MPVVTCVLLALSARYASLNAPFQSWFCCHGDPLAFKATQRVTPQPKEERGPWVGGARGRGRQHRGEPWADSGSLSTLPSSGGLLGAPAAGEDREERRTAVRAQPALRLLPLFWVLYSGSMKRPDVRAEDRWSCCVSALRWQTQAGFGLRCWCCWFIGSRVVFFLPSKVRKKHVGSVQLFTPGAEPRGRG